MPTVHLGKFEWKLRLWSVVGTMVLLAAFVALGLWQIGRAHQKEQIISAQKRAAKAPPKNLGRWLASGKPLSALYWHHVRVSGHADTAHTLLQDEQTRNGRVGYDIWVAVKLRTVPRVILVNRGWIPQRSDRRVPKKLPPMPEKKPFVGVFSRLPRAGLDISSGGCKRNGWPKVVLYPRHSDLACLFPRPLLKGIVRLDAGSPGSVGGLKAKVSGRGLSPLRHYGYALQWFAMGIALLVIYLVLNIQRLKRGATEND